MGVPHITEFCWCMGLEVGARCVGVLHLMIAMALTVVCAVFAEQTRGYMGTAEDVGDGLYASWYRLAVTAALLTVGHVPLAITLLVSVYKRNTTGLRVWVYIMVVLCVTALATIIVLVAITGFNGTGSDIFLSFLEGLLFFGILGYGILCVYSYYLLLKSCEDMEGPKDTDY